MRRNPRCFALSLCAALLLLGAQAALLHAQEERVDLRTISAIREEGLQRSEVMEIVSWLSDVYGPRLAGTPQLAAARNWSTEKMKEWGLANVALEPCGEIGRGWALEHLSVNLQEPSYSPLIAWPRAWTGSTDGVVRGRPVHVLAENEADLERYRGRLKGKIVLNGDKVDIARYYSAPASRFSDEDLRGIETYRLPERRVEENYEDMLARQAFQRKLSAFLESEEPAVIIEPSRGADGTLFVSAGGSRKPGDPEGIPQLVMIPEHFNRIVRILDKSVPVTLEIEVRARFLEGDTMGYNVIGEIPGTDPELKDEVVLIGGHIDSWHSSTGATDNAAGCAVAMEAARILEAIGVQPRRTIRVGLWDGEEQGFLGSMGYVRRHYMKDGSPLEEHDLLSVYFNYDNGSGRIRGVWLQDNIAAAPIFGAWMAPLRDLGVTTLSNRSVTGTDHVPFDGAGLPAFQFIQDRLDYGARTHHTNMDDVDHCEPADLMQSSVVVAVFAYHAAMRDEKVPRKVMQSRFIELTAEQMQALVGRYQISMGFIADISVENNQLVFKAANIPKFTLRALSDTRLVITEVKASMEFVKDESGKAVEVSIDAPGYGRLHGKRVQ